MAEGASALPAQQWIRAPLASAAWKAEHRDLGAAVSAGGGPILAAPTAAQWRWEIDTAITSLARVLSSFLLPQALLTVTLPRRSRVGFIPRSFFGEHRRHLYRHRRQNRGSPDALRFANRSCRYTRLVS